MTQLEEHAMRFWRSMQKLKHGLSPLSRAFARENELPTLAATTPFPKIEYRIYREIEKDTVA